MAPKADDRVSRRKYERETRARFEAEKLLEEKSRELFLANQQLSAHSEELEATVQQRTAELREALIAAEAASAMRSRFVATMSHEIRTPLGGLLGMIDLVLLDEIDPAKREYLEYAKTSGQALRRIVNDVLDFSKMEAGAFQFKDEEVDLRALIDGVVAMAKANLDDDAARLTADVAQSVPPLFLGDATRVRQVIFNLVSNAIRYSVDGKISVRACGFPENDRMRVRVEVEDKGVGITEQDQKNLFKDFTQIQNELTSAAQGTGLGLAISKRIVKGAGGMIGVTSVAGEGSTFWFELPVTVIEADASRSEPQCAAADIETLKQARVLLVEDNKINQKLLTSFLQRMGVEVELASNGQIAVDMFRPGAYDLILMDVAMPVMDGLQATHIIHNSWPESERPPIALLTAHVMETIEKEGKSVGVERVLSKPIAYDELQKAVAELLKSKASSASAEHGSDQARLAVFDLMTADAAESLQLTLPEDQITGFLTDFVLDARDKLETMNAHMTAHDLSGVAGAAHSLKGAAGLLGFAEISELAGHIEGAAEDLDEELLSEMTSIIEGHLAQIKDSLS